MTRPDLLDAFGNTVAGVLLLIGVLGFVIVLHATPDSAQLAQQRERAQHAALQVQRHIGEHP